MNGLKKMGESFKANPKIFTGANLTTCFVGLSGLSAVILSPMLWAQIVGASAMTVTLLANTVRTIKTNQIETLALENTSAVEASTKKTKFKDEYFPLWKKYSDVKLEEEVRSSTINVLAYAYALEDKISLLSAEDSHTLESLTTDYVPGALNDYLALDAQQRSAGTEATTILLNQLKLLNDAVKNIHFNVNNSQLNALKIRNSFIVGKFSPDILNRVHDDEAKEEPIVKPQYDDDYWKNLRDAFLKEFKQAYPVDVKPKNSSDGGYAQLAEKFQKNKYAIAAAENKARLDYERKVKEQAYLSLRNRQVLTVKQLEEAFMNKNLQEIEYLVQKSKTSLDKKNQYDDDFDDLSDVDFDELFEDDKYNNGSYKTNNSNTWSSLKKSYPPQRSSKQLPADILAELENPDLSKDIKKLTRELSVIQKAISHGYGEPTTSLLKKRAKLLTEQIERIQRKKKVQFRI